MKKYIRELIPRPENHTSQDIINYHFVGILYLNNLTYIPDGDSVREIVLRFNTTSEIGILIMTLYTDYYYGDVEYWKTHNRLSLKDFVEIVYTEFGYSPLQFIWAIYSNYDALSNKIWNKYFSRYYEEKFIQTT